MRVPEILFTILLCPTLLFAVFTGHDSVKTPDLSPYVLPYEPGRDYDRVAFDDDASPQSSLSSALIETKSSGTAGQLNSLALDGAPASHTKMAVNGMLINFAQNPVFDMSLLPLEFATDVEVYRNNLSASGIPATAGLVNFQLLNGVTHRLSAKIETGSFGFYSGVLNGSIFNEHVKIGAAYTVASNNFEYSDDFGQIRRMQNMDYNKKSLFSEWEGSRGRFFVSWSAKDAGTGDVYSVNAREKDSLLLTDAKWLFGLWQTRLSWSRWLNRYKSPGIDDLHNNQHLSLKAGRRWKISGNVFALHIENDSYYLDSTKIGVKYDNIAALNGRVLLRTGPLEWGIESSASYSLINGFRVVPAFSAAWNFAKGFQFFGRVSETYRAPSFNDLYWPSDAFSEGNPALEPEDGWRVRSGVLLLVPPFSVTVSGQWNEMSQMILWSNNGGKWRPENTGRQRSYGASLVARFDNVMRMWRLQSRLSLSLQRRYNNDVASYYYGKDSLYAPRFKAAWRVTTSYGKHVSLSLNLRYVSLRYVTKANTVSLPPYMLADAGLRVYFFMLNVNNIFNEHIEEVQGYPAPGRNWKAGLIFKW